MLTTIFIAALCFSATVVHGADDYTNAIIDEILYEAEQYLKDNKMTQINVPDVNVTYDNVVIDGTTVNGFINAQKGNLKDTTTLKRSDDAEIDFIGEDQMIVKVNVTFTSLAIHYDVFNFKLWIGSSDGGADIGVSGNEFHVKIVFLYSDVCQVTIDEAKTNKLSGYDMHLLPASVVNYFKNKVYTEYLNSNPGIGAYAVDSVLKDGLQKAADFLDICSYFPNPKQ